MKFHLTAKNRDVLLANISRLDLSASEYDVDVREHKETRSGIQNNRMWAIYADIGNELGYTSDEIHQLAGYKFLRYQKGDQEFIKSTTKLNTAEMASYQDALARWATELGLWIDY